MNIWWELCRQFFKYLQICRTDLHERSLSLLHSYLFSLDSSLEIEKRTLGREDHTQNARLQKCLMCEVWKHKLQTLWYFIAVEEWGRRSERENCLQLNRKSNQLISQKIDREWKMSIGGAKKIFFSLQCWCFSWNFLGFSAIFTEFFCDFFQNFWKNFTRKNKIK